MENISLKELNLIKGQFVPPLTTVLIISGIVAAIYSIKQLYKAKYKKIPVFLR